MTPLRLLRSCALAGVAFFSLVATAQAQDEGPNLQRLHDDLHLNANQEDAWSAFEAASQPDPQQQARERSAEAMMPSLTAPQRVDLSVAAAQADLETLKQRGAALKSFYAVLSHGQQAIFDSETLPDGQQ